MFYHLKTRCCVNTVVIINYVSLNTINTLVYFCFFKLREKRLITKKCIITYPFLNVTGFTKTDLIVTFSISRNTDLKY